MSEIIEQSKVTAGYERKVNLGNYEHEVFSVFVPVPVPVGATDVDRIAAGGQAFVEAREIVEGFIAGGTAPVAPVAQPAPVVAAVPAPQAPGSGNGSPVAAVAPQPAPAAAPVDNVIQAFPGATVVPVAPSAEHVQYMIDSGNEFKLGETYYDNRTDIARGYREFNGEQKPVSPNSPHFKAKSDGSGVWPLKDGSGRYA